MSGEGPTWRAQLPVVGRIEQLTTRTRQIQAAIDAAGMGDPQKARIATLEAENVALRAVEVAARFHVHPEAGESGCELAAALAALDATRAKA